MPLDMIPNFNQLDEAQKALITEMASLRMSSNVYADQFLKILKEANLYHMSIQVAVHLDMSDAEHKKAMKILDRNTNKSN